MKCVFVFLVCSFLTLELGSALECYSCDSCEPNGSYDKVTCQGDEKCYTMQTISWIIGSRREDISKGCAAESFCDEKNAAERVEEERIRKGPGIVLDYAPAEFKCAFCDSDLCNDKSHHF